ncbi:MAG: hypothetical protein HY343_11225, partial [Lentisphaerae bacterium]|nr:hypothetical protein [Lentisphaerota bacterium]
MNFRQLGILGIALILFALFLGSFQWKAYKKWDHTRTCIDHLRQIESGKDSMAMDIGLTNGWSAWDGVYGWTEADDVVAFSNMVDGRAGYVKDYTLCPASTTQVRNAAQAAHDYDVHAIGSNVTCAIAGGGQPGS